MVRVPGDSGFVENKQAVRTAAGHGFSGDGRQAAGRDGGQAAVGVVQQRDAGRPELSARLPQFLLRSW